MRDSVLDYALNFERATELEEKLRKEGFKSLPSERIRSAHYPSDLTSCIRQKWYNFKGVSETNTMPFETKVTLKLGDSFDDIVSSMSMKAKIYAEDEWSFGITLPELQYPISGRIDIILEEPDGKLIPAEVKTMNSNQFYDKEYKWGNGEGSTKYPGGVTEPKLYHVAQLMSYIYKMGTEYGYLIYFCKDNSDMHIHKIYWSEEFWKDIISEAKQLEAYLALDTLPPRHKEVQNMELAFYKRDAIYGKKGDLKTDRPNLLFPCGTKNADTGHVSFCKYFEVCWSKEILENPDASEEIKVRVQSHLEYEKSKGMSL